MKLDVEAMMRMFNLLLLIADWLFIERMGPLSTIHLQHASALLSRIECIVGYPNTSGLTMSTTIFKIMILLIRCR